MSSEIGIVSNLTGEFYAFPKELTDDSVSSMLSHIGLSSSSEIDKRLELERLERKLQYQERQKKIKKLVAISRSKSLYNLLRENTLEDHETMHKYTKETLDTKETPSEYYNNDVWSLSDDDDELVNYCPCFECRPLLYSESNHNRWKKEKEDRKNAMMEEYRQEVKMIKEKQQRKREKNLVKKHLERQEQLSKISKVNYMREKQILPVGWKVKESSTFPGKRYYVNTNTGDRLWETLDKAVPKGSFGWTVDQFGCVRDIYE
jgi:hypothetical protein